MPEAVIVATGRTPIGRANKGSLVDCRPDDLAGFIVKGVLAKVPQLDPQTVEDVIMGSGQPGGEAGYNVGRVAAILAGLPDVPGVTVNRYCSSSLQTIRMAAHAIRAGEGDVFVAAGVEAVSRYKFGAADTAPQRALRRRRGPHRRPHPGAYRSWTPAPDLPDIYIAMGQTAENVAESEKVSREEQDEFAVRSQNLAVEVPGNGFFEREIIPLTTPDGDRRDQGRRPPAGTTIEKLSELKPVFRRGRGHGRKRLPAQRRRRRRRGDERHAARELGITPLARIVASGVSRTQPRDHGPRSGRGLPPDPEAGQHDHRRHRPGRDQRGVRRPGDPVGQAPGDRLDKLNVHGGAIALGHPFGMTGARIMTTLLNGLEDSGKTIGLESMCVGGGQGMAMIVERLS